MVIIDWYCLDLDLCTIFFGLVGYGHFSVLVSPPPPHFQLKKILLKRAIFLASNPVPLNYQIFEQYIKKDLFEPSDITHWWFHISQVKSVEFSVCKKSKVKNLGNLILSSILNKISYAIIHHKIIGPLLQPLVCISWPTPPNNHFPGSSRGTWPLLPSAWWCVDDYK